LRRVPLSAKEVQHAIQGTTGRILEAVMDTLEQTPPELSSDIAQRGITLAGGGALLRGLPDYLHAQTGLPVHRVPEPLTCVALGAGRCLEQLDVIARAANSAKRDGRQASLWSSPGG
jgi:rod shape-determining protein MreB